MNKFWTRSDIILINWSLTLVGLWKSDNRLDWEYFCTFSICFCSLIETTFFLLGLAAWADAPELETPPPVMRLNRSRFAVDLAGWLFDGAAGARGKLNRTVAVAASWSARFSGLFSEWLLPPPLSSEFSMCCASKNASSLIMSKPVCFVLVLDMASTLLPSFIFSCLPFKDTVSF